MKINQNNESLYQDLLMIVQTYEEEIARSEDIVAFKVMSLKPLSGMNRFLNTSEAVLVDSTTQINNMESAGEVDGFNHTESLGSFVNIKFKKELTDLTGSDNLGEYLDDCFDCDLRLNFKWQMMPFNIFDSIFDLLDELKRALGLLDAGFDPSLLLDDLCNLLNNLRWLCIPDLIALLAALKLALQLKKTNLLKISFDWTVLLAPLLQAVLQILDSLLDGAFDIVQTPIECLFGALKTISDLEKAVNGLSAQVKTTSVQIDQKIINNFRSVSSTEQGLNVNNDQVVFGTEEEKDPFAFYTGTDFNVVTIPSAIADSNFAKAHWTSKLLVPIADVRREMQELKTKLDNALAALKGLTSSGLIVQIESLIAIIYIIKMIQLCLLLISIISQLKNGNLSFCDDLKSDPEKYNNILAKTFPGVHLSVDGQQVAVSLNNTLISNTQPCLKSNTTLDGWIKDLNRKI